MVTNLILPNDRLPINVERGAEGGPRFLTMVQPQRSGREVRIPIWSRTRGSWDIAYGIQLIEDPTAQHEALYAVIALFYNAQGRAASFRFRDWSDYKIGDPDNAALSNQTIGTGDGIATAYQFFKRYTLPSTAFYDRNIFRLVSGTLTVFVNAVEQTETTHYTVNYDTGLITFVTPPPSSQLVQIATEFDLLVRFDQDDLNISMETFEAGEIPAIRIVEIKE